jgi:hypothetical protein
MRTPEKNNDNNSRWGLDARPLATKQQYRDPERRLFPSRVAERTCFKTDGAILGRESSLKKLQSIFKKQGKWRGPKAGAQGELSVGDHSLGRR